MYCENCGKRIPDESQFCPECGAPVHHHQESPVARARKGDNAAVQQLMNDYRGMVRYQARMYVKNEDDINEIEQETFIQAFKNLNRLDDDNRFGGWLKTIAVNTSKNYVTTAFRRKSVMFTDLDDTNNNMVYDARDERIDHRPEVQMDETSRREIITKVLDDLPETQRMIIVMHYYDNLSFKDIAEQLNIPMSTVTGRAQMAKNSIKESVTAIQDRDGIKLYHLSPVAFFIWLLGLERTAPVTPAVFGKTVRIDPQKIAAKDQPHYGNPANNAGRTVRAEKAVRTTVKTTAKATAGKAAAGATTKAAGTGFLATAAGKAVIAGAIAVAAVGGSAAGVQYHKHTENVQTETAERNDKQVKKNSGKITDDLISKSMKDDKTDIVWIKKPGDMDIDDFEDIIFDKKDIGGDNFIVEYNGYSVGWLGSYDPAHDVFGNENSNYSNNAITVMKDGLKGIYDFGGKQLSKPKFNAIQSEADNGLYYYSATDDSDGSEKPFDGSFQNLQSEEISEEMKTTNDYLRWEYYVNGTVYGGVTGTDSVYEVTPRDEDHVPQIYPMVSSTDFVIQANQGIDTVPDFKPDGYIVLQDDKKTQIPENMTPDCFRYLDKLNTKDSAIYFRALSSCFVNGIVKLDDTKDKVHLWNYDTQSYVSDEAFDDATFYEDGYIGVKKNGKWAFMDENGKVVTDYLFDKVSGIYDGKAYVTYQGKVGIIDLKTTLNKIKK